MKKILAIWNGMSCFWQTTVSIFASIVLVLGLQKCAEAHPMSAAECKVFGSDMQQAAADRDQGITLKEQEAQAVKLIDMCQTDARFRAQCVYRDLADAQKALSGLRWMYGVGKEYRPEQVAETAVKVCTGARR